MTNEQVHTTAALKVGIFVKKVLTVAGSDCSGGAGIQADLKTMTALKIYGMSVITALTAQNTTGVYGVIESSSDFVKQQMDCVFQDIRPDAVKVGMVSNAEIIKAIADKLMEYDAENIVVDPVMVSTSGSRLLNAGAEDALKKYLFSIADVITPNIPEAEALCGFEIKDKVEMQKAAAFITNTIGTYVLIKGGHLEKCSDDLLYAPDGSHCWFESKKIDNNNTHGTGCTLSSAIACNLAVGYDMVHSIERAKKYVSGALSSCLNIGHGSGPLDHCWSI
jgi:hydroxymethylpyrimidine/phosphomethylpyrimidine kinase